MKGLLTILIAEDDDGHAELITDNLREGGVESPIERFSDGAALLDYLATAVLAVGSSFLVLMDIRMPVMDGVAALRSIKSSERLSSIPVIMLTTTDDPREIAECYALGCNFYISKPLDFRAFSETLRRLGLFLMVVDVARGDGP